MGVATEAVALFSLSSQRLSGPIGQITRKKLMVCSRDLVRAAIEVTACTLRPTEGVA